MLSVSQFTPSPSFSIHNGAMDGSGTIDPAALNTPAASTVSPSLITQSSPRGRKRSRSPEIFGESYTGDDDDDSKPRKRGRPIRVKGVDSPNMAAQPLTPGTPTTMQTPQVKPQATTQISPNQTSPQRSTPGSGGKPAVLKALPTVRDHTTDQLGAEGDEYIAREHDEAGERKVTANGFLVDREYRIRTFNVPNRGDKLFMLATECARVLGYRDSYLLFNKNRSLYKIIATQSEKENLINQEILPYSYRSRQIAIVTARSMFRQFGSRVIVNGRRVRDDYWESKAKKQGFTEEDAAGEKRPGAAKQRDAAAAAEASNTHALTALPQGEIIYSNTPGIDGQPAVPPGIHPVTFATLPMISNISAEDLRPQDYPNILRPRQEISGPAYQDRTISSNAGEILNQASNAAEFNNSLTQQRGIRTKYLDDYWKRPHEAPLQATQQAGHELDIEAVGPQSLHSPQAHSNMSGMTAAHQNMIAQQQSASHMMASQGYPSHQTHQQNMINRSPARSMHQSLPSAQLLQGSPAMSMASISGRQQTPTYNYPSGGMWPPPQPQTSPHPMQYGQTQHTPQPQPSPMHPPSQLAHQNIHMGYSNMNAMGTSGYSGMNRNMYQSNHSSQQYGVGAHQSSSTQQGGGQGWVPPSSMSSDWPRYQ